MKVINKFFFVTETPNQKHSLDNQPGVDQHQVAGPARKTAQAVQPSDRERENVKRKLPLDDHEATISKKQNPAKQPTAKASQPAPPTTTPGKATGISTPVQSERGPTGDPAEAPPEVDQQIQTPAGNAINERGSLVGESGNRKIQKRQSGRFGIIEVSSNMSRSFLLAFTKQEYAETFLKIIDIHYGHTKMQLSTFKQVLNDSQKIEHTFYWVVCKLGFNMGLESFKQKCGKCLDHCKYFIIRNITEDIEENNEIKDSLKSILQTLFENDSGFTTIQELIEKEQQRKTYNDNQQSKKRKLNFD